MATETFKPVPIKAPNGAVWLFRLRRLLDLQLHTIAMHLRPALLRLPEGLVLDVGAGQSPWKSWLPARCRYQGLDVQNASDFGMTGPDPDVAFYDGGTMPFAADTFASALCIEVLEHAQDPDMLMAEIHRVLQPGAPLLLSVPWSARRHHLPHDYHRFTRERLAQLFARHGFIEVAIHDRGNEYCVLFNKLFVLMVRNFKRLDWGSALYRLPLLAALVPFGGLVLLVAHVSLIRPRGDDSEDPLGYFCLAHRGPAPGLAR